MLAGRVTSRHDFFLGAVMHALDSVLCQDVTWRVKWNLGFAELNQSSVPVSVRLRLGPDLIPEAEGERPGRAMGRAGRLAGCCKYARSIEKTSSKHVQHSHDAAGTRRSDAVSGKTCEIKSKLKRLTCVNKLTAELANLVCRKWPITKTRTK